jgi:ribonuclease R
MAQKRKSFEKSRQNRTKPYSDERTQRLPPDKWQNTLLALLHTADGSVTFAEIDRSLILEGAGKKESKDILDALLQEGLVKKDGKRLFRLSKSAPLYEGILIQHPKGFGFVSPSSHHDKGEPLSRDPYISPAFMGTAQHGDMVLVRVLRIRKDHRPEAVVIRILTRGTDKIAGTYQKSHKGGMVYPDDPRFPFVVKIDDYNDFSPLDGDVVLVQFTREHKPVRVLSGKILEVLGSSDSIDTQMRLVIEKFTLPHQFSPETLRESADLREDFTDLKDREDLRTTDHVTIDGETAKDFDDAVCVIRTRKGYRLYVSIADVSHYVTPGSAIDQDAYARGTSIYFPGRVIPMLPEKLSNDLCSLVPGKDRFTVSAILDFDRSGVLQKKHFTRSVICSRNRFTYTTVRQILVDKDPEVRNAHKPFLTQLKWSEELAAALQARRKDRGSIDFNVAEPEFTLNDTGGVTAIARAERNFAHQMIEEFMLAANEAVASLFTETKTPAIYRVHEPPDPLKIDEFVAFATTLDIHLPPAEPNSAWFARALEHCRQSPYEYIINNIMLRSMKQAQYSADNVGHFGLASNDYTHFTSPIRRYPDLMVHRTLLKLCRKTGEKNAQIRTHLPLKEAGEFLSARERTAVTAERDIHERLKIIYMKDHVGESFDAVISGVNDAALFIEIQDMCISGSIAVDQLKDDYYLLDVKHHRLFGEISAKTYRIGDRLRVTLADVDRYRKRLNFKLAADSSR